MCTTPTALRHTSSAFARHRHVGCTLHYCLLTVRGGAGWRHRCSLGNGKAAVTDARKCVELAPEWSKGYSRLGAWSRLPPHMRMSLCVAPRRRAAGLVARVLSAFPA
jgi:hypothetical protein